MAPRVRLPGDATTPTNSVVNTPIAIRSGSLTEAQRLLVGSSPSVKFTPNVKIEQNNKASPRGILHKKDTTKEIDFAGHLAHSLSLQNQAHGRGVGFDDQMRRTNAPSVGGRAGMDRRTHSVQAKVQQHLQSIRKKGRKSVDLLELSWSEGANGSPLYTPISLPYVAKDRAEDTAETNTEGSNSTATKRPTVKIIDESNRSASSIFEEDSGLNPDESSENAHWILIQMPLFPALVTPNNPDIDTSGEPYQPTRLDGLPEGYLGKLRIHKSGRATLQAGVHLFDVNQGSDCNFAQEVAAYLPGESELMFLGRCSKRMVVTPNIPHYVGEENEQQT